MAASHETRGTFVEVQPHRRLKLRHMIDFIPGVEPYENNILVEFISEPRRVRMVITVDPHKDEEWTRRGAAGLARSPESLGARGCPVAALVSAECHRARLFDHLGCGQRPGDPVGDRGPTGAAIGDPGPDRHDPKRGRGFEPFDLGLDGVRLFV